jgi:GntR family transcriptional repressor for pyruvate dehydrogenase complex
LRAEGLQESADLQEARLLVYWYDQLAVRQLCADGFLFSLFDFHMHSHPSTTTGSKLTYRVVKSSRLYEQILRQLEEAIVKQQLKPGDQLPPERDMAQRFGVSRTAVREAVKALREKGLVEAYTGRGTFVTNGTSQVIRNSLDLMSKINQQQGSVHLAELRSILEPEIAALAAPRIDEQLLATMQEASAVMDRNLHDREAYIEADLDFHLSLAEAAGNPMVLALIDSIVVLLREQRSRIFDVEGGPERGQYHHKRILTAIENGDAEAARNAMRAHLQQVSEDSSRSWPENARRRRRFRKQ